MHIAGPSSSFHPIFFVLQSGVCVRKDAASQASVSPASPFVDSTRLQVPAASRPSPLSVLRSPFPCLSLSMYTTHRFNAKAPAAGEGFLTINDAYDKPKNTDPRVKGRQFQTNPPKVGQQEGYFAKFEYVVDTFQDNNGYRITQPRASRKLGFGSYDANRRDEFTLDIRAQQYRELLDKERFFEGVYLGQNAQRTGQDPNQAAAAAASSSQQLPADHPSMFQTQVPTMLYDIGKEGGTTPICNKCSRETFYCRHRVAQSSADTLRRMGPHKTAAAMVGAEIVGAEKPTFGRKSHIKDFYDSNHPGSMIGQH